MAIPAIIGVAAKVLPIASSLLGGNKETQQGQQGQQTQQAQAPKMPSVESTQPAKSMADVTKSDQFIKSEELNDEQQA